MKWCVLLGSLLLAAGVSGCFDKEAATSGQTGCSPGELEISDEDTGWNSETWTATCHGERYFCSLVGTGKDSGQVSCRAASGQATASTTKPVAPPTAAAQPSQAPAPQEPPTAVAGFSFGSTAEDAASACTDHGYVWQPGTDNHFRCSSSPVSIGVEAAPLVRFCDGKLCAVSLHVVSSSAWLRTFARFNEVLTKKYGAPADSKGVLYSNCSTEEQFRTCIMTGGLELVRDWKWPAGAQISLRVAAGKQAPEMKIIYVRRDQSEIVPEAL